MNKVQRNKLKPFEMIEHMKQKGITFNYISEEAATDIINNKNYFYKITAYRKNFNKINGQYKDLDFGYLVDLASIDMGFRYYFLQLSLDIEHGIKVNLLNIITRNPSINGYDIVNEFELFSPRTVSMIKKRFAKNEYLKDMYSKRISDIPIWVLLEIMDMGSLQIFIDFYLKKYPDGRLKTAQIHLKYARFLRNAAAHSNCILLNIFNPGSYLNNTDSSVVSHGMTMGVTRNEMRYRKINDAISLFVLHKNYTSRTLQERRHNEGQVLLERSLKNNKYYKNNYELKKIYKIGEKLIDYLK